MRKLTDGLLNREISDRINEASPVMGFWRREYNKYWLHNSLENRSLAPKAFEVKNLTWQKADWWDPNHRCLLIKRTIMVPKG